jgi:hypothetical protein
MTFKEKRTKFIFKGVVLREELRGRRQTLIEAFSIKLPHMIEERGYFFFSDGHHLLKKRPALRYGQYKLLEVFWWKDQVKWVFFDYLLIEKRISEKILLQKSKYRYLILFKDLRNIVKPENAIFKIINVNTREFVYCTLKNLYPYVRVGGLKIDDLFSGVETLHPSEVEMYERKRKSKTSFKKLWLQLELEREDFNEQRRKKINAWKYRIK